MSEQAVATAESPGNGNVETPPLSERKYGGEPSMSRVKQLLSDLYGPSPAAWIQGLLKERAAAPTDAKQQEKDRNWRKLEAQRDEAYRRGKADGRAELQAEIVFAERLAAVRARYPDFDAAWNSVRPLLPRCVWEEIADLEHGLEASYRLARLPALRAELAELDPEQARQRFRHFVKDVVALGGLQ